MRVPVLLLALAVALPAHAMRSPPTNPMPEVNCSRLAHLKHLIEQDAYAHLKSTSLYRFHMKPSTQLLVSPTPVLVEFIGRAGDTQASYYSQALASLNRLSQSACTNPLLGRKEGPT